MPKWLCDKLLRGQRTPHAALDDWESTAMRFQYWSAAGVGIPAASFTLRTVACNAGYASGPLAFIQLGKSVADTPPGSTSSKPHSACSANVSASRSGKPLRRLTPKLKYHRLIREKRFW